MKSDRVVSPAGVGGELLYTVTFAGLASSAGLTWIRCAKPVNSEPALVIAPVYGELESVKNGSCGLPLVNEVTVVVVEAEFTVTLSAGLAATCNNPEELANCRCVWPSAAFNCDTTDVIPPVKSTPITCGLAPGAFCSGSALGSSTRTICTCCCWPALFV